MKHTLKTLMLCASIAVFSTGHLVPVNASGMSAEAAIAAAKEAQMQANSVGGEWRDTDKMIKKAEQLLKEGKTKEAAKMAEEAEAQAMLGYIQATSQTQDKLHI